MEYPDPLSVLRGTILAEGTNFISQVSILRTKKNSKKY